MLKSKTFSLEVNDIFDELKVENNRLNKQLLFAEKSNQLLSKFRNNLIDFYNCCKCEQNIENKIIFTHLQNEYNCISNEFDINDTNIVSSVETTDQINDNKRIITENNLIFNQSISKQKVKQELGSDWDQIHDFEDNYCVELDDENDSENWSKTSNKDNVESIDNNSYLTCDSIYSVVKKKTKTTTVDRLSCNFNGCHFECLSKTKMQRHVRTSHSTKKAINCSNCEQMFWTQNQLTVHIKRVHKEMFDWKSQKFICTFIGCNLQFKKLNQLKIHRTRHLGKKEFKCSVEGCDWSFFTAGELRNHAVGVHPVPEFYCDWIGCGEGFIIKSDLDLHKLHKHCESDSNLELLEPLYDSLNNSVYDKTYLKSEFNSNYSVARHRKSNRITHYICNYNYCDFKCTVKDKMETHISSIHILKSPINCIECSQMFWTQKLLTNHIRPNHSQLFDKITQKFRCSYEDCSLLFDRYSKLLLHRNRHFGEKSFKCSDQFPECNWTFFTLGELRNHQLWSHTNDTPFLCDWDGCKKRFKLKNLLADHKLTHTGDMPFKCEWPGCDMKFVRQTSLRVHMSSHVGLKPYKCDWPECGQAFRTNSNLRTHYSIHTNEKKFVCEWPGCDSRFISSSSLRRHKLVHQNVGQFSCTWPLCVKKFKSKFSLKIHVMAHSGEKPFRCEAKDCDMSFVEKKQMRKHFRRRHLPKF